MQNRDFVVRSLLTVSVLLGVCTSLAAQQPAPEPIAYGQSVSGFGISKDFVLNGSARDVIQVVASSTVGYLCVQILDAGTVILPASCRPHVEVRTQLPRTGPFIIRVASINLTIPQPFNLTALRLLPAGANTSILNPYSSAVSMAGSFAAANAETLHFWGVQGTSVTVKTKRDLSGYTAYVCFSAIDPLGNAVAGATGACGAWGGGVQATVSLPFSGVYALLIYEYSWTLPEQFEATITCSANCSASPRPLKIVSRNPLSTATFQKPYENEGELLPVGGSVPFRGWGIASGKLPPGLAIDPVDGKIRGVPSATGTYQFNVSLVDAAGAKTTQPFVLRVAAKTTQFKVMSSSRSAFYQNGALLCSGGRGFTIAVVDVVSGQVDACTTYDTWYSDPGLEAFSAYVRSIPMDRSKLVLIATGDENGLFTNSPAGQTVRTTLESRFGARRIRELGWRGSYALLVIGGEQIPLSEGVGSYFYGWGWTKIERSFTFETSATGGIQ